MGCERSHGMKTFYVVFYKNNKAICGTWRQGKDKDEATCNAEFAIMCRFPNVEYDFTEVTHEASI